MEFKAGYESKRVDYKQAVDYSYMAEAGKVNARGADGEIVEKKIGSVNYLFSTQKGAENNEFIQDYATLWFMDENDDIQLYGRQRRKLSEVSPFSCLSES
ncbi:MAG: hypothetical protein IPH82_20790 [Chloroflexi bacterium]|nr:hypothetical protein [Chloroflexota bacterium]